MLDRVLRQKSRVISGSAGHNDDFVDVTQLVVGEAHLIEPQMALVVEPPGGSIVLRPETFAQTFGRSAARRSIGGPFAHPPRAERRLAEVVDHDRQTRGSAARARAGRRGVAGRRREARGRGRAPPRPQGSRAPRPAGSSAGRAPRGSGGESLAARAVAPGRRAAPPPSRARADRPTR